MRSQQFPNDFAAQRKKTSCEAAAIYLFADLPNFARACGCVSIGGVRTRGRTAAYGREIFLARCSKGSAVPTECRGDRQPEAKPVHPALNGGRGLKQRRSGLFW